MNNFEWAMALKALIFPLIIFLLYKIIPEGRVKTALFRERPWNFPAWLLGTGLIWAAVVYAIFWK
jgi:hypothetical protein